MRYFYNTKTKLNIVDVSGKKTLARIAQEFGGKAIDYQTMDMTEAEEKTNVATIVSGNLIKKKNAVPVNVNKQNYSKLTTQAERTNFIAERLGLK